MRDSFDVYPIDKNECLIWRFENHPIKKYKVFISHNDKWQGYIILRIGSLPEDNMGIISEIFATSSDGYNRLIEYSIIHFRDQKCDSINVLSPLNSQLELFENSGFFKTNKRTPILLSSSSEETIKIKTLKKWFFSFESQDMDFFPNKRL